MLIGGVICHRAFNIPIKIAWQADPKISTVSPIYEADAVLIDEVAETVVNNSMTGECFKKIVVSVIAMVLISGTLYLQYGRELDVKGSYYSGDTLSFNVILNRLWYI
ncbi:hypothetical protein ACTNEY_14895 [Fusicatenibacter saccharivorans]|uniref:hypothetical protein n=1 Tax=Fusicatenibacter saccharivorans TaxID=1150298 RepID=UPI003F88CCFA